jgi:hypothetical protein
MPLLTQPIRIVDLPELLPARWKAYRPATVSFFNTHRMVRQYVDYTYRPNR